MPRTDENTTTLSGNPPCPDYNGPAPCPIDEATGMHHDYWVLTEEERSKGFLRPVRDVYRHETCGQNTVMHRSFAETYARDPGYYTSTFCATCRAHYPVGATGQFIWLNGEKVGT